MSDPLGPRRGTPDPRAPRASDGYAASREAATSAPGGPPPPQDEIEAMLAGYARSTELPPASDLTRRIHARISREPARTPPRRFLVALLALRLTQARDAFRQTAGVAVGRGRFPAVVRGQALLLVALTVLALGGAALAGAIGVREVVHRVQEERVERLDDSLPSPSVAPSDRPSPWVSPTTSPSARPSASPSLASPSVRPTGEPGIVAPLPTVGPRSHPTPEPTARAGRTPGAGGDRATPRPGRTPRPTPRATPHPARTPRPPAEPTKHPPTPRPTDDGGDGHGGDDQKTPGPAETPHGGGDDENDTGLAMSGVVTRAGTGLSALPA